MEHNVVNKIFCTEIFFYSLVQVLILIQLIKKTMAKSYKWGIFYQGTGKLFQLKEESNTRQN
jgi:hypothetical protein